MLYLDLVISICLAQLVKKAHNGEVTSVGRFLYDTVSADLYEYDRKVYLTVMDLYSGFTWISEVKSKRMSY